MFGKIIAVILTMGVVACVLLAVRQQRVQAAHELAEVQRRVLEQDRLLWQLRTEIAARVVPRGVAAGAGRFGPTAVISPERFRDLVRREQEERTYTAAQP
ncbi:MAG: hypothetical protein ACK4WH_05895 [Phycisphaerales bacterium]